jgi:hypothetical protein
MRVEDLILRLRMRENTSCQKKKSSILVLLKQILWHKWWSPTIKIKRKSLLWKTNKSPRCSMENALSIIRISIWPMII